LGIDLWTEAGTFVSWDHEKAVLKDLIRKQQKLQDFFITLLETLRCDPGQDVNVKLEKLDRQQSLDYIDTAIDSFVFSSFSRVDAPNKSVYGTTYDEQPIRIEIWNMLEVVDAQECRRCTELHEICHALRFYVFRQEHHVTPTVSPIRFRPGKGAAKAYGVKETEGELGLWFQEQLFGGTACFVKEKHCQIATEHSSVQTKMRCATDPCNPCWLVVP
jgi:hypothetical protein